MNTAPALVVALTLASPALALAGTARGGEASAPARPGERDVRSYGALCDGIADDRAALQAAYDALTTDGGTLLIPAGARCAIGGEGVEPRGNVALRCEKGAKLVALPGARGLFRTAATIDGWSVTGCELDLAGVAAPAWESSGGTKGGTNWAFRDNLVHGMPSDAGEPLSSVRLDCTLAGAGQCLISGNTILGSDAAARSDTCLTVSAGGFVGFNTQVVDNYLHGCGHDCLEVRGPGGVTVSDNVLVRCRENAADNSTLNSVWTGNQLATVGDDAGPLLYIHDTIGNQVIVGNQLAANGRSSAPAIHAVARPGSNLAGLYVDDNYAAQGVFFDAQGRCQGGSCDGTTCEDDTGCSACGGRCTEFGVFDHDHVANLIVTRDIRIENATNLVVQGNVVIGVAGKDDESQIRLVALRRDRPIGGIIVADNQLAKRASRPGRLSCIELDDAGGGGFAGVTIASNSCGLDPALDRGKVLPDGVKLTRPPATWRAVLVSGNNFENTADALVGFTGPVVSGGTRLHGNRGLDPGDAQPLLETFAAPGGALEQFAVVEPSPHADDAVARARPVTLHAIGCTAAGTTAAGAAVPVAVAGVATCLASGAEQPIQRGDPLAMSREPGRLARANPGERIFGYAMQSTATRAPIRVLVQPSAPASVAAKASAAETR